MDRFYILIYLGKSGAELSCAAVSKKYFFLLSSCRYFWKLKLCGLYLLCIFQCLIGSYEGFKFEDQIASPWALSNLQDLDGSGNWMRGDFARVTLKLAHNVLASARVTCGGEGGRVPPVLNHLRLVMGG